VYHDCHNILTGATQHSMHHQNGKGSWQRRRIIYPVTWLGLAAALMLVSTGTGRRYGRAHTDILSPASAMAPASPASPGAQGASDLLNSSGRSALATSEALDWDAGVNLLQAARGPSAVAADDGNVFPDSHAGVKQLHAARAPSIAPTDDGNVVPASAELSQPKTSDKKRGGLAALFRRRGSSQETAPPPAEGPSAVAASPGGAPAPARAEGMEGSTDGFDIGALSPEQHEALLKVAAELHFDMDSELHTGQHSEPELKSELKSEIIHLPEPKPESEPEAKPETDDDLFEHEFVTEHEVSPELQSQLQAEFMRESTSELHTDAEAESEPESSSGLEPEAKAKAKPESKPEPEPEAKADHQPQGEVGAKPEAKADPKPEAKSEAEVQAKAEAQPESEAKAEIEAGTKSDPETAPKADQKSELKPEPKPETEAKTETKPESEAKEETNTQSETKAHDKPEAKSESEAGAKAESEPESEAKQEIKTESETKADDKPEAKSESEAGAKSEPKPEPEANANDELEAKSTPESGDKPEPKPDAKLEAESEAKAESKPDPKLELEAPAPAPAEEEDQRSNFSKSVQWDTPVADLYGPQYFAMCLAIKNQHGDIREWVAHHKAVGAGTIYVYDMLSEPPLNETLQDHIDYGFVKYIRHTPDFGDHNHRKYPQLTVYKQCHEDYGKSHQFLAYLDADEFLVMEGGTPSVPALLRRMMAFEPFGGLVVNWRVFGSSGHITRPEEGVLRGYSKCMSLQNEQTIHVKTIANTEWGRNPDGPHHWSYKPGFYAVNEHFQRVDGYWNHNVSLDKIAIHHYVLKSLEEYMQKAIRGSAMGNRRPLSYFYETDIMSNYTCTQAHHYGPYS